MGRMGHLGLLSVPYTIVRSACSPAGVWLASVRAACAATCREPHPMELTPHGRLELPERPLQGFSSIPIICGDALAVLFQPHVHEVVQLVQLRVPSNPL